MCVFDPCSINSGDVSSQLQQTFEDGKQYNVLFAWTAHASHLNYMSHVYKYLYGFAGKYIWINRFLLQIFMFFCLCI